MHGEAIALLFFPSLPWASLGCWRSLPPCWRRAGPGLCSLIRPLKRVGNKPPVDSQSSKQARTGRAVRDGCRAPGLPESPNCLFLGMGLRLTRAVLGTRGSFCFSHRSPLGDPTPPDWTCCILLRRGLLR